MRSSLRSKSFASFSGLQRTIAIQPFVSRSRRSVGRPKDGDLVKVADVAGSLDMLARLDRQGGACVHVALPAPSMFGTRCICRSGYAEYPPHGAG